MPGGAGGKEVGRISIRVVPDLDGFREKLRAELEGIQDIKIKVEVDTKGVREQIEAAAKDAKAVIRVDADTAEANAKIDHAARNRTSRIKVDVDRSMLDRLTSFGGFGGGGGALKAGGGGLGMLGSFADTAALVAAVAAIIAPALALIATSLAALPALLSAIALPIGTVVLGLGGFKKALEDVGLASEDKKGKLGPGAELKKLQEDVSNEFQRGLTPIFRELVGLLPMLRQGFTGIARGIVADIQGLSDAFTKGAGPGNIQNIFRNVGEMLNQMAPGLNSFASGILSLASKVSDHLPGLAQFFDEWGTKFSNWVDQISKDGTLDKAISGLKPVLDSVMNFVAQMMDAGVKLMADPTMAQNIKTVLDGVTNFAIQALPALNQLFSAIADFVHLLHLDKPAKMEPGKGGPGGPVSPLPAAPGSGGKFSWVGPPGGTGQPFNQQSFLDQLEGNPGQAMSNVFRGLDQAMAQAGNKIAIQWDHVKKTTSEAWNTVVSTVSAAWDNIIKAGEEAANKVVNAIKSIPDKVKAIVGEFESIGRSLMEGLKRGIDAGIGMVKDAVSNLAGLIPQWAKDMLGIHSPSTEMEDVGQSTAEGLKNGLDAGAAGVVDRARRLAQEVQEAISGGFSSSGGGGEGTSSAAEAAVEKAHQLAGTAYVSGVSDCSGAVSQVYSAMVGRKVHFTTLSNFAALGFKPGFKPGALNIGVSPEHMAATLPSGESFESGGSSGGGVKVGAGAHGALDKQFPQHWYFDTGGGAGRASAGGQNVAALEGQIKEQLNALDIERDKLQAEKDALPPGKDSKNRREQLKGELQQIKMARDALVTQRDELKAGADSVGGSGSKGGKGSVTDSMTEAAQMITKGLAQTIDMAKNFVMASVEGVEQDLGISGKGAIPTIANLGLGWAQGELNNMIAADFGLNPDKKGGKKHGDNININVNSVDEAMAAKTTLDNRKSLQWNDGR